MRTVVEGPSWEANPIRFFILDLALVAGVDMSAAEAFVRIQRLLRSKDVVLVFCGFSDVSPVGRALRSVDLLEMDGVELFSTFNDALECEFAFCHSLTRSIVTLKQGLRTRICGHGSIRRKRNLMQ